MKCIIYLLNNHVFILWVDFLEECLLSVLSLIQETGCVFGSILMHQCYCDNARVCWMAHDLHKRNERSAIHIHTTLAYEIDITEWKLRTWRMCYIMILNKHPSLVPLVLIHEEL